MNGPNKTQKLLTMVLIVIGVVVVLFFGTRLLRAFRRIHPPGPPPLGHIETDVELIRGWMTIPYIARAYGIPEPEFYQGLNIEPSKELDRKSLADLNKTYFPGQPSYVVDKVKEIIQDFQATHPTPTP